MIARRTFLTLTSAGIALGALAACSKSSGGGSAGGADSVEVFTWWAQGSEKAGLDALVKVFNEQNPKIKFVNGSVAGGAGSAAKDMLQSRLQTKNPPDTFQAHAGGELTDYINAGQIEDVSGLYDEFDLRKAFPDSLVELLTVDGKIYSVPSNIHRSNVVWASAAVLEKAGIDPKAVPETFDAWLADLEKAKAAGVTALSLAAPWTQVNLLEAVLMSHLGADAYNGLFDGSTDWAGAEVTTAIAAFEKLVSYTNSDRDSLDWPEATALVIDEKAAYNVMGDWAVAAFQEAGKEDMKDYVYFEVPRLVLATRSSASSRTPSPCPWVHHTPTTRRRGSRPSRRSKARKPSISPRAQSRRAPTLMSRSSRRISSPRSSPSHTTRSVPRSPTVQQHRSRGSTPFPTQRASSPPARPTPRRSRPSSCPLPNRI